MAQERSQAGTALDRCLAAMSRWATALPVFPLLTGLYFAASTLFACAVALRGGWFVLVGWAPVPTILFLIVGIGLGFVLRWGMMCIRDAGRPGPGILVLVGVGLAWIMAFFVQFVIFAFLQGVAP